MMEHVERDRMLDELVYVKKEMPEVLYRKEILDGEPVSLLYHAVKKEMFHLKGESDKIWELIDGKRTLRMIAKEIADDRVVDEALILKNVVRFVVKLGRLGFIKFAYKQNNFLGKNYGSA